MGDPFFLSLHVHVLGAAKSWWESKRPLVYSLAEHLENPAMPRGDT